MKPKIFKVKANIGTGKLIFPRKSKKLFDQIVSAGKPNPKELAENKKQTGSWASDETKKKIITIIRANKHFAYIPLTSEAEIILQSSVTDGRFERLNASIMNEKSMKNSDLKERTEGVIGTATTSVATFEKYKNIPNYHLFQIVNDNTIFMKLPMGKSNSYAAVVRDASVDTSGSIPEDVTTFRKYLTDVKKMEKVTKETIDEMYVYDITLCYKK